MQDLLLLVLFSMLEEPNSRSSSSSRWQRLIGLDRYTGHIRTLQAVKPSVIDRAGQLEQWVYEAQNDDCGKECLLSCEP